MMDALEAVELDYVQDDLVRAVMYPFAMADYEGNDAVSINAVASSIILENARPPIINEALSTAQWAGLIGWDSERVGAIRLSELGLSKLRLVRDDFLDDDEISRLRDGLRALDPDHLHQSEAYASRKAEFTGLGVFSGQLCPISGRWHTRRPVACTHIMRQGELTPGPFLDDDGNPVIWYLMKSA
jgi:hypothetical protein